MSHSEHSGLSANWNSFPLWIIRYWLWSLLTSCITNFPPTAFTTVCSSYSLVGCVGTSFVSGFFSFLVVRGLLVVLLVVGCWCSLAWAVVTCGSFARAFLGGGEGVPFGVGALLFFSAAGIVATLRDVTTASGAVDDWNDDEVTSRTARSRSDDSESCLCRGRRNLCRRSPLMPGYKLAPHLQQRPPSTPFSSEQSRGCTRTVVHRGAGARQHARDTPGAPARHKSRSTGLRPPVVACTERNQTFDEPL